MRGSVIQGFLADGRARLPAPVVQPSAIRRASVPPTPAFAGRLPVLQVRAPGGSFQVDPMRLGLASAGGRALSDAVRGRMETALGADFSAVRVRNPMGAGVAAVRDYLLEAQADRLGHRAASAPADEYNGN
jgi:hypothetical protein